MKGIKIAIVDYGVGNTHSVSNAIQHLGYKRVSITNKDEQLKTADVLILPGVGAFHEAMNNLRERNLIHLLEEEVLAKKKPILGICVGMQVLATQSEENGIHAGLNWIEGTVKKLKPTIPIAVPHVGWNEVYFKKDLFLTFHRINAQHFYFDHSYWFDCPEIYKAATCDYGLNITAAVQKDNIFGVQFHPEKSQNSGLKLFRSFFNSISC